MSPEASFSGVLTASFPAACKSAVGTIPDPSARSSFPPGLQTIRQWRRLMPGVAASKTMLQEAVSRPSTIPSLGITKLWPAYFPATPRSTARPREVCPAVPGFCPESAPCSFSYGCESASPPLSVPLCRKCPQPCRHADPRSRRKAPPASSRMPRGSSTNPLRKLPVSAGVYGIPSLSRILVSSSAMIA